MFDKTRRGVRWGGSFLAVAGLIACASSANPTNPTHPVIDDAGGGKSPGSDAAGDGTSPGSNDAGGSDAGSNADAGATTDGDAGPGVSGGGTITGTFGIAAIKPMVSGIWIGKPGDPTSTGGGPFIYLFSGPITCADLKSSGWLPSIPTDVQVLELLIGTTAPGTAVPVALTAASGKLEANWANGGGSESRALTGSATLTTYSAGNYVEGTVDVKFLLGTAKGTFHADWCPDGQEI